MHDTQIPELLTPKEVAEIFRISYPQALQFIKYSGIDYIKIGNQFRVCKHKLNEFLNIKGQKNISLN